MMHLIRPILTIDIVLFTLIDTGLAVILQHRNKPPFSDALALIGGYVHPEEDGDTEAAARRVLRDKAGVSTRLLEQIGTFSGPSRDPRGWSASVAYCGFLSAAEEAATENLTIVPWGGVKKLPFDHNAIIEAAFQRCRRRASYSSLPAFLLPDTFTLSALRNAYETLLGRKLNDSAFRRKIYDVRALSVVKGQRDHDTPRPAQLYRRAQHDVQEFNRTL